MSVSTKSPFAFVCRIVISVDAGAVADASADSTSENAAPRRSTKNVKINTSTDAVKDSSTVMITSCFPLPLNDEILKYSPAENAINASAMSDTNAEPSITFCGTAFRQNGPMIIPATIYAVTFGNFRSFVSRVIKNPLKRIIASARITAETGDVAFSFSYNRSTAVYLLSASFKNNTVRIFLYAYGFRFNYYCQFVRVAEATSDNQGYTNFLYSQF